MFFEDCERDVQRLEEVFERELSELLHRFPRNRYRRQHKPGPIQVLFTRFNNQNFIIMDPLVLSPGTQAPIQPALIDSVTLQPIPGATFVPKSNTVDNSAIATVDANNNLVYGSAGTANLTSVNTWTYTDQNTGLQVVADQTTIMQIKMLSAAEAVQQTIALGAPVAIPAPAAPICSPSRPS